MRDAERSTDEAEAGRWFGERLTEAQAGQPGAFDELVRWIERPLVAFLDARGADDPRGMANDVLVRVFLNLTTFQGGRVQFRAWTFRIARNMLVDQHRHVSRRPDVVPTAPEELHDDAAPDAADRIGERERVEALLANLTDEQREVLLMRIVAGLSVEETAQVLGRRPGAIRALQHRGLTRLRAARSSKA